MVILRASPGCVYTDGEAFGETVCLPDKAPRDKWREISKELAENMQAEAQRAAELASRAEE